MARATFPDREIHVVDSMGASMGEGVLAELGVKMANEGAPAAQIAETLTRRREDIGIYLALDTLEYLKRGGRISGAQAAIGTLLSVKPIIEVKEGKVETADRVRTRRQGPRAPHRAAHRPPDRAPLGPPHDQRRGRGVRRAAHGPRGPGQVAGDDRPRRPVGGPPPRDWLRWRGGALPRGLSPG